MTSKSTDVTKVLSTVQSAVTKMSTALEELQGNTAEAEEQRKAERLEDKKNLDRLEKGIVAAGKASKAASTALTKYTEKSKPPPRLKFEDPKFIVDISNSVVWKPALTEILSRFAKPVKMMITKRMYVHVIECRLPDYILAATLSLRFAAINHKASADWDDEDVCEAWLEEVFADSKLLTSLRTLARQQRTAYFGPARKMCLTHFLGDEHSAIDAMHDPDDFVNSGLMAKTFKTHDDHDLQLVGGAQGHAYHLCSAFFDLGEEGEEAPNFPSAQLLALALEWQQKDMAEHGVKETELPDAPCIEYLALAMVYSANACVPTKNEDDEEAEYKFQALMAHDSVGPMMNNTLNWMLSEDKCPTTSESILELRTKHEYQAPPVDTHPTGKKDKKKRKSDFEID